MLIFLDTEFTKLPAYGSRASLISIGMVSEDGQHEFYAELPEDDGWTLEQCSNFVIYGVLPLLNAPRKYTRDELQAALRAWFAALPRSVTAACDFELDFRFLIEALGDPLPANLAPKHFDLAPFIALTAYNTAVNQYYTPDHPPHHALTDAHAHRRGWLAWGSSENRALRDIKAEFDLPEKVSKALIRLVQKNGDQLPIFHDGESSFFEFMETDRIPEKTVIRIQEIVKAAFGVR